MTRIIYTDGDNKDYFKTWSSNMAYILGFYCGDGCIYERHEDYYSFSFRVNEKDDYVLEFIRDEINPERKIHYFDHIQDSGHVSKMCSLLIPCQEICRDIFDMGFKLRKTYNTNFPEIPEEFKPDFLRGLFDSDGCAEDTKKRARIYCIDRNFLEKARDETIKVGQIYKESSSCVWYLASKANINIFRDYIYNGGFCLKRKYDKLMNIEYRPENNIEAFGESKSAYSWSNDKRCSVYPEVITYRLEKYGDILSTEQAISLGAKELWDYIPSRVVLSPDKKIYKLANIDQNKRHVPVIKTLEKIIKSNRKQSKNGWSVRKVEETFDEWKIRTEGNKRRSKNLLSDDDFKMMWDDDLILESEFLNKNTIF